MLILGERVSDRITGFKGIVVSRREYLYASPQVLVQPETIGDDGAPQEAHLFEESQLERICDSKHVPNFDQPQPSEAD